MVNLWLIMVNQWLIIGITISLVGGDWNIHILLMGYSMGYVMVFLMGYSMGYHNQ